MLGKLRNIGVIRLKKLPMILLVISPYLFLLFVFVSANKGNYSQVGIGIALHLDVLLLHVFIIPLLPFLILFDYLLLLSSSAYGISGLLKCYRAKEITMKTLIVNIAAQLIFCADVFSSIYCYRKVRK